MKTTTKSPTERPLVVIGANGQIGFELVKSLSSLAPVLAFERRTLDITQTSTLRAKLVGVRPLAIVNAAAFTAVDDAENEPALAAATNAVAPGVLATVAAECGACFVHYSTDYVFDGHSRRPYRESDPVAPTNVYGHTKLAGERAVMKTDSASIILRTSWVYSNRRDNFLLKLQRLARTRTALKIVNDQFGCPTPARFIATTTAAILRGCSLSAKRLHEARGIYHLAASGETSWYEFARAIVELTPNCKTVDIEGIPTAQYPTLARRPAYSALDSSLLHRSFGLCAPHWHVLLAQTLEA